MISAKTLIPWCQSCVGFCYFVILYYHESFSKPIFLIHLDYTHFLMPGFVEWCPILFRQWKRTTSIGSALGKQLLEGSLAWLALDDARGQFLKPKFCFADIEIFQKQQYLLLFIPKQSHKLIKYNSDFTYLQYLLWNNRYEFSKR